MSPKQREVLTKIGLGRVTRADLGSGHGVTQAVNALVRQGRIEFDEATGTYRRIP